MLRFAYNTNGCADHRLDDALELIAEAGYSGVALTLDWHHLDPFADGYEEKAAALAERLRALDLDIIIETGAGYLMDPRERHEPTLLHPSTEGRARRLDLIRRAIRICQICNGQAVNFFSGRQRRNVSQANAGMWLLDGLAQIVEAGAEAGVAVALEPAPGHLVATLDDFILVRDALKQATSAPLKLSLDVGHCLVTNEREPHFAVKEFATVLGSVTIEDMKRGVHEHLPFGAGDLNIPAVLTALEEIEYQGLVSVELPGETRRAHVAIGESYDWLQDNLPSD